MSIIACPKCSARLRVDDDLDPDDRIECTRCGKQFRPPQDEVTHRGKKVQRAGGCAGLGCILLIAIICGGAWLGWSQMKQQALDDLAAGDRLYAEGKKGEAAAKYKAAYSLSPGDRKAQLIGRIADHEASAGDKAEARRWVEKGLDAKLTVSYERAEATNLHAQVLRERAEAEAKKREADANKKMEREAEEQANKTKHEKKERYGTYREAMSNAEKAIRMNLPFPNDATFHALGRPVIQNPDGSWQVSGTVTTRDSFGNLVTYQFFGAMLRTADGAWGTVGNIFLEPQ